MEERKNVKQRDAFVDLLKAFAITLVVLGHSIQFGNGQAYLSSGDFLSHPLFIVIYGFHMPLFMVISGYLFKMGIDRKTFGQLLVSRFYSLLLPIVVWGGIGFLIRTAMYGSVEVMSVMGLLRKIIGSFAHSLWFLWALFYCSIAASVVYKFLKNSRVAYLVLAGGMFVTPDGMNLGSCKYVFPFFVLPFFLGDLNLRNWFSQRSTRHLTWVAIVSLIAYGIICVYWRNDFYIYTTGVTFLGKNIKEQALIDFVRWVAGFVGIFCVVASLQLLVRFFPRVMNNAVARELGARSLGIYAITGLIFSYLAPYLVITDYFSLVNVLWISILSLFVSTILTICISKNKLLNTLMLGART